MIDGDQLPTLESTRVRLRWLTEDDAPRLFEIFRDPELCRYWSSPPQRDVAEAAQMVREIHELFREGTLFEWGVALRDTGELIGTATLAHVDRSNRRCEIGFSVARERWGHGYASETIATLLDFAFGRLHMHRIEADVDPRNAPSIRALEKFGFQREGLLRERWIVGGQVADTVFLGLLEGEWRARGANAPTVEIPRCWKVLRQDDHGTEYEVRTGLGREDAERLARDLEARGHKQMYWAAPE